MAELRFFFQGKEIDPAIAKALEDDGEAKVSMAGSGYTPARLGGGRGPWMELVPVAHPKPGDVLFTDAHEREAVQIVRREGTTVWYVPLKELVRSTHEANLYDKDGGRPYSV